MDRYIRTLSMDVARRTSRRNFLGQVVRGAVGVGLGAGFLMGGSKFAWADANCVPIRTPNGTGGCNAQVACKNGDAYGCHGFTNNIHTANYCPQLDCDSASKGCKGNHPTKYGYWTCCCKGQVTMCVDCGLATGTSANCICVFSTGTC